jgi:pyruvate formate lyase activating enzyme
MRDKPSTPPATLSRARDIAIGAGLRYVYTGNVYDEKGGSTHCHACGKKLIGRDWYRLTAWNLDRDGNCRDCGTRCDGYFAAEPGGWGAKRAAVDLSKFA